MWLGSAFHVPTTMNDEQTIIIRTKVVPSCFAVPGAPPLRIVTLWHGMLWEVVVVLYSRHSITEAEYILGGYLIGFIHLLILVS